jgi:hypothetical protein
LRQPCAAWFYRMIWMIKCFSPMLTAFSPHIAPRISI